MTKKVIFLIFSKFSSPYNHFFGKLLLFFLKICYGHEKKIKDFSFLFSFSFLDASGFMYRSYHAFPKFINTKGQPLGALLGFVTMMLKYNDIHEKTHWACVFDQPGEHHYWRRQYFPDYKKKRPSMPEDFVAQLPFIYKVCDLLQLPMVRQEGQEADDLLASLQKKALDYHEDSRVVIASSDKDLHQLVSPRCSQYDPLKQRFFQEEDVREKWGVEPWQIPHVQALCGDPSDGIPGIPGIGLKTATQWIQTYTTYKEVFYHHDSLEGRRKIYLQNQEKQGDLCYTLALLRQDLETPPLESFIYKEPSWEALGHFLYDLELHNLGRKILNKIK